MMKYVYGFLAILTVAAMSGSGVATTVRAYSTQELVEAADLVAQGRVIEATSLEGRPGRIVTDVRIAVGTYVLGSGPQEITVRLEGGELGEVVRHVPGEARLKPGDETLLFLTSAQTAPRQIFRSVGLSQGVFKVIRSAKGAGSAMVTRDLKGLRLIDEAPDGLLELASSRRTLYVPLEKFIATIRGLARLRQ